MTKTSKRARGSRQAQTAFDKPWRTTTPSRSCLRSTTHRCRAHSRMRSTGCLAFIHSPRASVSACFFRLSPSMGGGNRGLWALRVPLRASSPGSRVYPGTCSLLLRPTRLSTTKRRDLVSHELQKAPRRDDHRVRWISSKQASTTPAQSALGSSTWASDQTRRWIHVEGFRWSLRIGSGKELDPRSVHGAPADLQRSQLTLVRGPKCRN